MIHNITYAAFMMYHQIITVKEEYVTCRAQCLMPSDAQVMERNFLSVTSHTWISHMNTVLKSSYHKSITSSHPPICHIVISLRGVFWFMTSHTCGLQMYTLIIPCTINDPTTCCWKWITITPQFINAVCVWNRTGIENSSHTRFLNYIIAWPLFIISKWLDFILSALIRIV